MLRLFIAWPLDDAIRRELARITGALRPRMPAASWPRPESIHLTFAFLGDTPAERVDAIARSLDSCADARAIDVRGGEVGLFPDERRPRVAWIGLEPHDTVSALAGRLRAALADAGIAFDPKPFRPHLTVARVKAPWRASDVAALRDAFRGWSSPAARLDRVVLYESRLDAGGAVHTELHALPLRTES
ncbi:MAG TPA: RNA 2',3'-cyclic phosphodiesterase [Thermoanaerobaculia bacterium]